jgi:catalase
MGGTVFHQFESTVERKRRIGIGSLWIGLVLGTLAGPCAFVGAGFGQDAVTPARIVDRFEEVDGVHAGFRRNHAKGLGVAGFFESNGNGARLSKAAVFQEGRVPAIGRCSLDGGLPFQPDRPDTRRGLGLQLTTPNGEVWRTALISFPLFPVRTPEIFFERLLAFEADSSSGRPDHARVKAFEERHPETVEVLKKILAEPRSSGFGNTTFHGLNTFLFTNATAETTPVRWHLKPVQPFEAAGDAPPDKNYLFEELITQIHRKPLRWRLIVIVGKPGDPTNDPSIGWPADRERVDVGTLTLDRVEAEETSPATEIFFDPLVLPVGMAPSDDRCSASARRSIRNRTSDAPARRSSRARSRPRT